MSYSALLFLGGELVVPFFVSYNEKAILVGPMASGQKTNAYLHRPAGQTKRSETIAGQMACAWNRASIVSKPLLENGWKGTVLDETIQAPIPKEQYNSMPLCHKPLVAIYLDRS